MDKDKLLSKVDKLLRTADTSVNTSEHEADTALLMVHKLLKKHGLSMADVMTDKEARDIDSSSDIKEVEGATFKCAKIPKWMTIIVSVVNTITDTRTVIKNYIQPGETHGAIKIMFIGVGDDVVIANELFHYLKKSVTSRSSKHQRETDGKFKQWRSFAEGCSCTLMAKALNMKKAWDPETAGSDHTCDIDNYEYDSEDELEEEDGDDSCDISNFGYDEDDYSDDTRNRYAIIVHGKKTKIEEYMHQMKAETEHLSTSANLDPCSFELGILKAKDISLKVHNLVN
jgi:hypothetical protein